MVVAGCDGRGGNGNYRTHMNSEAMFIIRAIEDLAMQEPELFREMVMRKPETILDFGLYSAATNSLPNAFGYAGKDFPVWPNGIDPWGKPYCVDIRLSKSSEDKSGKHFNTFSLKMWSAGPNGKNENGAGDDLVFGPFELDVRCGGSHE